MRNILWLLVILLVVTGCAKSIKDNIEMESGRGCVGSWEWCFNCTFECMEVQKGKGSKEVNEERGEPGVGIEIMK